MKPTAGADQVPASAARTSSHGAARRPGGPPGHTPAAGSRAVASATLGANRASWLWGVYAVLGVCLVAYVVSEAVRHNPGSLPLLDNWGVAGFEVVLSLLCISRAVFTQERGLPLVLGLGLLSWSVGDLILAAEMAGTGGAPSPSVADVFYLGFYPLTYVGVFLLARRQIRKISATTWLDGAVAGLGAAAVCAEFSLRGVNSMLSGSTLGVATNLAYPIGDLLLLTMVVAGSTVLPGRRKTRWLLLAAGYGINAIGDTVNLFQASIGSTHVGTVFNAVAWPTSILLVSVSVWLPAERANPTIREPVPGLVVPGIAAIGALVVLALSSFVRVDRTAFGLAVGTLVLAVVRSGLSFIRLRDLTEEHRGQAVTDQLTALGNRRALFELLDGVLTEREQPDGGSRRLAFLFIDLNRFKEVNDSFGHSVGDELLRLLGGRLRGLLRSTDLLVRLGGDEFAACLTDSDADYGVTVARRIGARLEEPFLLGEVKAQISASIGIAVVPDDATNAHDLLRCADRAMYRAKVEGKCFAIYQEELDGQANRLGLVEDLRLAIVRDALELHYQPQVDLATGEVVAVEALVRWPHPRLGDVPPLEFLPLVKDSDLMDPLTALVLDKALAQGAAWRAQAHPVRIAVNISTSNLLNPEFPTEVERLLHKHRLSPDTLVLEITEATAMEQIDQCKAAIRELRDTGVGVSIDDFGAGFTSLAYLGSLAVNELKLDRSFINGLAVREGSRDLTLIRSTIDLAHALGLRVVAEGVEEQTSLDLLSSFGCDLAQGYLISKPKPAGELSFHPEAMAAFRQEPETAVALEPERAPNGCGQWSYGPLPSTGTARYSIAFSTLTGARGGRIRSRTSADESAAQGL